MQDHGAISKRDNDRTCSAYLCACSGFYMVCVSRAHEFSFFSWFRFFRWSVGSLVRSLVGFPCSETPHKGEVPVEVVIRQVSSSPGLFPFCGVRKSK